MDDVIPFFADIAARHPRCFWLDGGGAREWSGRRSMVGWLDDDDVSLTYDAATRTVTPNALFVYGTLMRGQSNHSLIEGASSPST